MSRETPEELTEDWKARKLPTGWYFVKVEGFREVDVDLYDKESNSWLCNSDKDLNPLNVITSIPTCDEYKAMQEKIADLSKKVEWEIGKNKALENQLTEAKKGIKRNLKAFELMCDSNDELLALLKECKEFLENDGFDVYSWSKFAGTENTLLTRINTTLGESEE